MSDDELQAGAPGKRDELPLLNKASPFSGRQPREESYWGEALKTQRAEAEARDARAAEHGLAIVNVSNKAQLKTEIIRAQAKADFEQHLEAQEAKRARQREEAEHAALLKNKKALAEKAAIEAKSQAEMMQNLMAEPHLEIMAAKPLKGRNTKDGSALEGKAGRARLKCLLTSALLVVLAAVVAMVLVLVVGIGGVSLGQGQEVVNSLLADDESRPYVEVLVRLKGLDDPTYFTCVERERKETCKKHKSDARRAMAAALGGRVEAGDVLLREVVLYGESLSESRGSGRRRAASRHLPPSEPPLVGSARALLQEGGDDQGSLSAVFRIVCENISSAVLVRDKMPSVLQSSTPGSRWKEGRPATGTEITNQELASALSDSQRVFSSSELEGWGVAQLACDTYLQVPLQCLSLGAPSIPTSRCPLPRVPAIRCYLVPGRNNLPTDARQRLAGHAEWRACHESSVVADAAAAALWHLM